MSNTESYMDEHPDIRSIRHGWVCDHEGCTNELRPIGKFSFGDWHTSGWYNARFNAFTHLCPEHAGPWRVYDDEQRAALDEMYEALTLARYDFEAQFEEDWRANHNFPQPPPGLRTDREIT